MGTATQVIKDLMPMVDNTNPAAPPMRLDQISGGQPQNEAHTPEQPVLEDNEADESSLDEMFFVSPRPRAKRTSKPKSDNDPSLLAAGYCVIKARNEALSVPFTQISDAIRHSLEDVEKTKGGPKKVLAKLRAIAHEEATKKVAHVFDSDVEENPDDSDESLLECIRRMMMVEAVINKAGSKGPKKKGAQNARKFSSIPPGGTLNMKGGPGESTLVMDQLKIQEYSNKAYWRFAPYLEAVRCILNSNCKCITDYFRRSVTNSRTYISPIAKGSMVYKKRTSGSCARPWKKQWSQ